MKHIQGDDGLYQLVGKTLEEIQICCTSSLLLFIFDDGAEYGLFVDSPRSEAWFGDIFKDFDKPSKITSVRKSDTDVKFSTEYGTLLIHINKDDPDGEARLSCFVHERKEWGGINPKFEPVNYIIVQDANCIIV